MNKQTEYSRKRRARMIAQGLRWDGKPRMNTSFQSGNHPNRKYRHPTRTGPRKMNPMYMAFVGMHERCQPNYKYAHRYYDRGIWVDPRWAKGKWDDFGDWALANGYEEGLELDRRDNDKGYSPENCRFVTHAENTANRDIEHHRRASKIGAQSKCKPIRRLDTGEVFPSLTAAAAAIGSTVQSVWCGIARKGRVKGVPFDYVKP